MKLYTVRYFNIHSNSWCFFHSTYDALDASNTHSDLLNRGYKASITQAKVSEV